MSRFQRQPSILLTLGVNQIALPSPRWQARKLDPQIPTTRGQGQGTTEGGGRGHAAGLVVQLHQLDEAHRVAEEAELVTAAVHHLEHCPRQQQHLLLGGGGGQRST